MVLTGCKAALAALLLLCSACSVSAQYAVSFTFVAGSSTGLTGTALTCALGGGSALFSGGGALRGAAFDFLLPAVSFFLDAARVAARVGRMVAPRRI